VTAAAARRPPLVPAPAPRVLEREGLTYRYALWGRRGLLVAEAAITSPNPIPYQTLHHHKRTFDLAIVDGVRAHYVERDEAGE
jgi:hypothetical protein